MYLSIERTRLSEQYNDAVKKGLPTDKLEPRIAEINEQQNQIRMKLGGDSIPDAPYKKNWQEMAMRRAIQMAADGGYERVAFTTGAQQADRYNLAKQVENVTAVKNADGKYNVTAFPYGQMAIERKNLTIDQVEDLIGKDLAKKIQSQEAGDSKQYIGLDLQVGGEGMKGFYDKILPDYVNKYGKKYGMKVGQTKVKTGQIPSSEKEFHAIGEKYGYTPDEFDRLPPSKRKEIFDKEYQGEDVHYFDLTPEAKSSLLEKGSPLFAAPALGLTGEESRREILEKLISK